MTFREVEYMIVSSCGSRWTEMVWYLMQSIFSRFQLMFQTGSSKMTVEGTSNFKTHRRTVFYTKLNDWLKSNCMDCYVKTVKYSHAFDIANQVMTTEVTYYNPVPAYLTADYNKLCLFFLRASPVFMNSSSWPMGNTQLRDYGVMLCQQYFSNSAQNTHRMHLHTLIIWLQIWSINK